MGKVEGSIIKQFTTKLIQEIPTEVERLDLLNWVLNENWWMFSRTLNLSEAIAKPFVGRWILFYNEVFSTNFSIKHFKNLEVPLYNPKSKSKFPLVVAPGIDGMDILITYAKCVRTLFRKHFVVVLSDKEVDLSEISITKNVERNSGLNNGYCVWTHKLPYQETLFINDEYKKYNLNDDDLLKRSLPFYEAMLLDMFLVWSHETKGSMFGYSDARLGPLKFFFGYSDIVLYRHRYVPYLFIEKDTIVLSGVDEPLFLDDGRSITFVATD
jgi:hypothetical protein